MARKLISCLLLLFIVASAVYTIINHRSPNQAISSVDRQDERNYRARIVLIPLDSRPPCTQFVKMIGKIYDIEIITPPLELMDNYKRAANKKALAEWLFVQAKTADAAIVSVDMLTHGSLLASRLSEGTADDSAATLALLKSLKECNPQLHIYAFNIIPRLLLADSRDNAAYQKKVLEYSILKDQYYTFENYRDAEKLVKLENEIPQSILNRYNALYDQNNKVNIQLANMVQDGTLTSLVIGQDDGQPFGIPNINKQLIQHYSNNLAVGGRIVVTRGTDEVALTMLGRIIAKSVGHRHKIHVIYSDEDAPRVVMPYMPHSVETTVREKISLVGGTETSSLPEADFVLYIHIGTKNNMSSLPNRADHVKSLISEGYKVALVDLSENFSGAETILPWLKRNNADITKLIAYAGWNTTSNSIGTAVTQAIAYTASTAVKTAPGAKIQLLEDNLEFLAARILDDWYFQKDVQPYINRYLKAHNKDPYNLNNNYYETNHLVSNMMQARARVMYRDLFAGRKITVDSPTGPLYLQIENLSASVRLPWQRTFEVYVEPHLSFSLDSENYVR